MTSVYHQLHCLKKLQFAVAELVVGSSQSIGIRHVEHCFNYLRQGITCGGDVTLEGPDIVDGVNKGSLHGWNVSHSCVDWESLRHWMMFHGV